MALIGNVVISVFASHKELTKSLKMAGNKIGKFAKDAAKKMAAIGAGIATGLAGAVGAGIAMVDRYAERIDKLAKTSSKLGTTVGALQKLQYQAELTGVGANTLNTALQRMVRRISEVSSTGKGTASGALQELKLSAEELAQLSPEEQFYAISEAMKQIGNQGDKVRLAMKIFDTEGVSLVNTMNSNLAATGAEFEKLGITVTQSQAAMVEAYNDSKTKLGKIFSGFGIAVTAQLAGPFQKLIEYINQTLLNMGGMEQAAKKFASFILEGVKVAIKAVQKLIEAFSKLENIMLRVQKALNAPAVLGEAIASKVTGSDVVGDAQKRNLAIDKQIYENNQKSKNFAESNFITGLDKLLDNMKISVEEGAQVNTNHFKAIQKSTETVQKLQKAEVKAAEKTTKLAESAQKAADALDKTAIENKSKLVEEKKSISQQAFGSLGGKSARQAIGGVSTYSKVDLNLQTDAGVIAGRVLAEPTFISGLKTFNTRHTNEAARAAVV